MSNTAIDCVPYISKASVISVRRWLMIGSVVLASGQLAGCGSSQPEPAPLRTALTATVQQASSSDTQITGIVRSLGSYDIAPENPGRLVRLRANIGDRVAQGQILAEFDAEPFRLQASQSRAQMQAANVDLDAARREAKRLEGLVEAGAAARQDLDAARTNVSRAEAQQRATSDQAALNARALAKTQLRAPVAGVITARQGELGAILPAGAPCSRWKVRVNARSLLRSPARRPNSYASERSCVSISVVRAGKLDCPAFLRDLPVWMHRQRGSPSFQAPQHPERPSKFACQPEEPPTAI